MCSCIIDDYELVICWRVTHVIKHLKIAYCLYLTLSSFGKLFEHDISFGASYLAQYNEFQVLKAAKKKRLLTKFVLYAWSTLNHLTRSHGYWNTPNNCPCKLDC